MDTPSKNPPFVLPEITDPERLPIFPMARYYIDSPLSDPEEENWVEAESTTFAAMMAQTLYRSDWRFVLLAWRDKETGEVTRFAPSMEGALALLDEMIEAKRIEVSQE